MNENNIIEITLGGIRYRDDAGVERFIDFAACYQRHVDERNDPERFERFSKANPSHSKEELEASLVRINVNKQVGWRNVTELSLQFNTDPPRRFEFSNSEDYYKVLEFVMRQAKWRLIDMT